ncbi:cytochrome P450 [Streptomyces sp. NBC_01525]|uniref:cytochrome P450 n=1 Tax=Streptomyces sp. NBC_01525 TaxID=2903893 RepID=UPI00386A8E72
MTEQDPISVPHADGSNNLFDWLTGMRAENPVWQEGNGPYHVFRYDDVQQVISDPKVFSNDTSRVMPHVKPLTEGHINAMDPPEHGKLRRLVNQAFTPQTVDKLETRITAVTNELLAEIGSERFDLIDALTYPLPVIVISELLGIPASDRDLFRKWADRFMNLSRPRSEKDIVANFQAATREMDEYLLAHCRQRRGDPKNDLISKLATAEVEGERLTDDEVVKFAGILFLTGHLTTTLLIGNAVQCLDDNPETYAELRADRSLIPSAVEEVLRFRSPFTTVSRVTVTDVEVGGRLIPANRMVTPWVISANHDDAHFPDAGRFVIRRTPNRHVAFGRGGHFCVGAPLARLEARVALNALLDTFTELRVDRDADIAYHARGMYGAKNLPVVARRA